MTYIAFLRSINVGGRNVKMDRLRLAFKNLGFANAQTVLASGNVVFQSPAPVEPEALQGGLRAAFDMKIGVVVRSLAELKALVERDPFAAYQASDDTKFYLGMAAGPIGDRLEGITSVAGDFDLVSVDDQDYFCVAFRQRTGRYGAGLDQLEKRFKDLTVTTRNWNTIARIIDKAGS